MGRGMLLFKGDEKATKKKKSQTKPNIIHSTSNHEKNQQLLEGEQHQPSVSGLHPTEGRTNPSSSEAEPSPPDQAPIPSGFASNSGVPKIQQGRGKITTSGTVVTGHDTRFLSELGPGDALLVSIPAASSTTTSSSSSSSSQQEMRVITMRLSDVSLNLSSAFSQDVKYPTQFSFIRKPTSARQSAKEAAAAQLQRQREAQEEEVKAAGHSAQEFAYRQRTAHGSYRTIRTALPMTDTATLAGGPPSLSRTELLHLRAKKTSDKYC